MTSCVKGFTTVEYLLITRHRFSFTILQSLRLLARCEFAEADLFSIELERNAVVAEGAFVKSKSEKARIDIFLKLEDRYTHKKTSCCAIELKFFLKKNHREPNNRYDVFKDLHNLENYGHECDLRYFIVGTDHKHYFSQSYSNARGDFDFSDRKSYTAGRQLVYKTPKPYDKPLMLSNSYEFKWERFDDKYYFMKLEVLKRK
jgi:hypothetical protein